MKTIKNALLVLAITFASVVSASTVPTNEEPSTLTQEIVSLLKNPEFIIANDMLAKVTFVLNSENEIVVLTVDTNDTKLENYIKDRLNYSKLSVKIIDKKKTYTLPVRLTVK